MKESFYFPHDNNAHNDPKLMTVFMKTWLSWIWLYWIIIEIMHQQESWKIKKEQYDDCIRWYTMNESKWWSLVEHLLNIYLTSELFCLDDEWYVYSKRVLENKKYREELIEKRSEAWKKSALARQKSTSVEQVLNKERKGKEIKGKEIKEKDNSKTIKQKDNSLLEKERDKYPIGSWRYKFYSFLLSHTKYIEHDINEQEIEKIDKKILEYRDKLWDDRAKLELESFCEYHRNENTIFKSTIGRLNTWLSNKLWK